MPSDAASSNASRNRAVNLYQQWVRARQNRPPIRSSNDPKLLPAIEEENFRTQLVEPRKRQLDELKATGDQIAFPDKVALLVTTEIPTLETSTLLQRLAGQLAVDPDATYFSQVNMADNCGCGCGCCCAAMTDLSYQEQIVAHYQTKPYSIDPFNELGTAVETRDNLRVSDFLESFQAVSAQINTQVNQRFFEGS
jgi:hypothetical protein